MSLFEDRTFENILNEMLDEVPDDRDKRQGSVIYDALAPIAAKMAQFYVDLNTQQEIVMLDTTTGEYLVRKGKEIPLDKEEAVKSVRRVNYEGVLPVGSRFFTESGIFFIVISDGLVQCEEAGIIGNNPLIGTTLIPVSEVAGLISITLQEIVVPGEEEESDDSYRANIFAKLQDPEFNSNKSQVIAWCKEVDGVGAVKLLYDVVNGVITLTRAIIINSEGEPPAQEIIDAVQEYIDPNSEGLGEGKADIGVKFLAQGAIAHAISVSSRIVLAASKTLEEATLEFQEGLQTYLNDIVLDVNKKDNQVRYNKVGAILANMTAIVDYSDLQVNGETSNQVILDTEVATVGVINLYE